MLLLDPQTRIIDLTVAQLRELISGEFLANAKSIGSDMNQMQTNLGIDEAAERLNYKPSYLRTLAKKAYNLNPKLFPERTKTGDSYNATLATWKQVVKIAKNS